MAALPAGNELLYHGILLGRCSGHQSGLSSVLFLYHINPDLSRRIAIRRPYCVAPVGRVEGSSMRSTARRNSDGRTGFSK
jgi:hypothetical protein